MRLPSPRQCLGIVGLPIAIAAGLLGLWIHIRSWTGELGFVLLAVSGLVLFTSAIFCLAWGWDHVGRTP